MLGTILIKLGEKMKKSVIGLMCLFITSIIYSGETKSFSVIAKEMNLKLIVPKDYKILKEPEQEDVLVNVCYKKYDNVEYRIGLYPDSELPSQLTKATNNEDLMKMLMSMTYTICLNISQDTERKPKIRAFDSKEVKNEFGADAGVYDTVPGNSCFSKGYNYVSINSIYKKGSGLVVVYVLIKDINDYLKNAPKNDYLRAYYAVKYN